MFSNSLMQQQQQQPPIQDKAFRAASTNFEDSIADLSWSNGLSGIEYHLACSTWDSRVHFYRVTPSSNPNMSQVVDSVEGTFTIPTAYPCISLAWKHQTGQVIAGSIDGSVSLITRSSPVISTIGKHEDAVKGVYCIEELNVVISVSYDKTLKLWDLRSSTAIKSCDLGAKAVCSDLLFPNIAIGLNNEKLLIFDVTRDGDNVFQHIDRHYIDSPLGNHSALSAVSISQDNIIGIGTNDGRSNLSKIEKRDNGLTRLSNIVTFKAHKIDPGQNGNTSNLKILYPIHSVGLHPRNKNTYFTAGGDGTVMFWDIPARNKLTLLSSAPAPVTAARYSPCGRFLAYAFGYDWAKGIEGSKSIKPKLHIHTTLSEELAHV